MVFFCGCDCDFVGVCWENGVFFVDLLKFMGGLGEVFFDVLVYDIIKVFDVV